MKLSSHPWYRRLCFILLLAFVLTGIFGRDPWKADEPYSFGIMLNFTEGYNWLIPHVAADPFLEKPPLTYWVSAMTARVFQAVLPLHEGAKIALIGWLGLMLVALFFAARRMYAGRHGLRTCMLFLGTVGFVTHSHKLTADIPQLAGLVLALTAFVYFISHAQKEQKELVYQKKPVSPPKENAQNFWFTLKAQVVQARPVLLWGLLLGTGTGIAFMSKGILIPGMIGILSCVLIACFSEFRMRSASVFFVAAFIAFLPWLLIWPYLLWRASEPLFIEWFWNNNFGRFFGFANTGGTEASFWKDIVPLVFLSFPASWIVIGGLFSAQRRTAYSGLVHKVLWIYFGVVVLTLLSSASFRELYILPLYPALALLAAGVVLPERLEVIWNRLAIFFFSLLGLCVIWFWGASVTGHHEFLPHLLGKWLPLNYQIPFSWTYLAAGVTLILLWISVIVVRARADTIVVGFAGLTLAWGLMHTLLLPWLNEARSYRVPFKHLALALPAHYDCFAVYGLGESERAMLDYFVKVKPIQVESISDVSCQVLLIMDRKNDRENGHIATPPSPEWQEIWRGHRPGDNYELFRAYFRRSNNEVKIKAGASLRQEIR